jgi:hypothetical protein
MITHIITNDFNVNQRVQICTRVCSDSGKTELAQQGRFGGISIKRGGQRYRDLLVEVVYVEEGQNSGGQSENEIVPLNYYAPECQ